MFIFSFKGLDLSDLGSIITIREDQDADIGRKAFQLRKFLTNWQESFSAIEKVVIVLQ